MALDLTRRRFTTADYHQMARAGILGEDDRVELIDGEVIEMSPIGRRHASYVDRLMMLFARLFADVVHLRVQNPLQLDEYTEPQPDLLLLRRRADFYLAKQPTPEDVLLLIEVADTSVEFDRRVKVPLYARYGIPEAWLVDLEHETITVYREPVEGGYRVVRVVRRGERIAPAAFPDRPVAVDDILG